MTKRLCLKCGIKVPLENFRSKGGYDYAKTCKLHDDDELSSKAVIKKRKKKARVKKLTQIKQHENYMEARHRGPRRVTQMKASRLPTLSPEGMTANDYAIYLTSPHWAEFRSRYANALPWECFVCGDHPDHLHHVSYARLGMEKFEDAVPLCKQHHKGVHRVVKQGISLAHAHVYVRTRYERGELEVKISRKDP